MSVAGSWTFFRLARVAYAGTPGLVLRPSARRVKRQPGAGAPEKGRCGARGRRFRRNHLVRCRRWPICARAVNIFGYMDQFAPKAQRNLS
jgi:hypothetical protein